jgi:pantothenate kinase
VPLSQDTPVIYAPSFDHSIKDPVENDIPIPPTAKIVVLEGNYLSLNKGLWKEAAALMDELWFVEVDFEIARRRLVARHVKSGIVENDMEADRRVTENDLVNGREIVEERLPVHEIIESREDDAWRL